MRHALLTLLLILPSTAFLDAEETAPSVGVAAKIDDLILPGTELEPVPLKPESPIVVRITAAFVHGDAFRYQLEYYGLEPGSYDLSDWLRRRDGSSMENLPAIPVHIRSSLPEGQVQPRTLTVKELPARGGYRTLLVIGGILWLLVLLLLLFWRRRRTQLTESAAAQVSLADRLRPLVESARRGELPREQHAELERTLLAFWRERLGYEDLDAAEAIGKMRQHEEAGALLRALEDWLHRPQPAEDVDVNALLEPYA